MNSHERRLLQLERKVANLIRYGVIASVNASAYTATVTVGKVTTAPLRWLTHRAGTDIDWWAPEVGEQVVIFSPSGRLNQGAILPALYQTTSPPPATNTNQRVEKYADGTTLTYDRSAHLWHLDVPESGAEVRITTAGAVNVTAGGNANLTVGGNLAATVTGTLTASVAGNVSVSSEGNISLTATGTVTIQGTAITLTGPVAASATIAAAGGISSGGGISASGDVSGAGKSLDSHVHTGVTAGIAVSGPPQ